MLKLDDAEVAGIAMRGNTDTDWGRPEESEDSVLGLTPPLLDVDIELLKAEDLGARLGKLGLVLVRLALRLFDVELHPAPSSECADFPLERFDRINMCANKGLDGSQVVFEGGRAHHKDLLGCRF